ncbi:MAG: fibrobacter succinogenes major paralogous domain-containing protein [Bacteroidales bacterium]|nr:fibrobacter succinogenes major paralogous domain-containing protein [Bacteroidales bacterium]
MKRILTLILLSFLFFVAQSQVPQKFSYQAVIRNTDGTVLSDTQAKIKVLLHSTSADGTVVYSEDHSVTTSSYGIVNLVIGDGSTVAGIFADIPWENNIFIEIQLEKSGETSFTSLGTSQILSIPYALNAVKAQNGIDPTRVEVTDSSVNIKPREGHDTSKPIFVVQNTKGEVVMAVYDSGVRFYVDSTSTSKETIGGFSISGLSNTKSNKTTVDNNYFTVEPNYTQISFNNTTSVKGAKRGFAVGGLTNATKSEIDYFTVAPEYSEVYFDQTIPTKGAKRGFAVGGLTNATKSEATYLTVVPEYSEIKFDKTLTKGAKRGFAVGGLTNATKMDSANLFEVTPDSTYFANTMVAYTNMLVAGNVSTGVGLITDKVTDVDGNTYPTVKIGAQTWMAGNLIATNFNDGTAMSSALTYKNTSDADTLSIYGRLYSYDDVVTSGKNVCPTGWHVPKLAEWEELFAFIGGVDWMSGTETIFKKMAEPGLVGDGGLWSYLPFTPTNETGFDARPAGGATNQGSWMFLDINASANFWAYESSSPRMITFIGGDGMVTSNEGTSTDAYSVRCVKDIAK